jgi:hypothetical protein
MKKLFINNEEIDYVAGTLHCEEPKKVKVPLSKKPVNEPDAYTIKPQEGSLTFQTKEIMSFPRIEKIEIINSESGEIIFTFNNCFAEHDYGNTFHYITLVD